MNRSLFEGELVRLTAAVSEDTPERFAAWSNDAEYLRLVSIRPALPTTISAMRHEVDEYIESEEIEHDVFEFLVRPRADDRLIGFVALSHIRWNNGDAMLSISIGDRAYWGRGYGTDAVRVLLRFAFTELNLHRVTLGVFEYNERARRAYEKAGFVVEGRVRAHLQRDGRRWDNIYMGILREEWERTTASQTHPYGDQRDALG
jgi:RimJ/RimL family protein N-acetyltransferase